MTPPEMQEGHREVQDDPYDMADQYVSNYNWTSPSTMGVFIVMN